MQMHESKAAAKPAPSKTRMSLGSIVTGKVAKPARILLYGIEGVGKSTFAADAPGAIFLGTEDGTAQIDTARFPEPQSWADVLDAIEVLRAGEHSFHTLAIDTLDWLEPLCWAHTCQTNHDRNGKPHADIEAFGYGKGYAAALDVWRDLLARLDTLRNERGMQVILVAHSWIKAFKNPAGDDFDRYELKLHGKAAGLLKEWADAVLFATHETYAHKAQGENRAKGVSTGARVIYTERTAAYDAKNRYDLPEMMPLSWADFAAGMAAHRPADPAALRAEIAELLPQMPAEIHAAVKQAVTSAKDDAAGLARIAGRLRARLTIENQG